MTSITLGGRGCGDAQEGGTYMVVGKSASGTPVWTYMLCPPIKIDNIEKLGVAKIGMQLIKREDSDTYDIFDWIGESGYPNVMDWVKEVGKMGFHQKVAPQLLLKVTEDTNYYAIHSKAWMDDPSTHYNERFVFSGWPKCPQFHEHHMQYDEPPEEMCSGLYLHDIRLGKQALEDEKGVVYRTMPSFTYKGQDIESNTTYSPAIFFALPVGILMDVIVYKDHAGDKDERALKKLEKAEELQGRVHHLDLDDFADGEELAVNDRE